MSLLDKSRVDNVFGLSQVKPRLVRFSQIRTLILAHCDTRRGLHLWRKPHVVLRLYETEEWYQI